MMIRKKRKKGGFLGFEFEAIRGIAEREITKYLRNKNQIISSTLMPAIFMIFLRPAFANWIGDIGDAGKYMGSGIILMVVIMAGIMMAGMPLIFDKMLGFQDIYAVAPVKRRNLVLGFILGGAIKVTIQCTIVFVIGLLTGLVNFELGVYPYDFGWFAINPAVGVLTMIGSVIAMYILIFISAAIYACIGLSISARTDMTNAFLWFTLINMPLVYISGAMIPIENMGIIPPLFNPTTYFADAIRVFLGGFTGNYGTGNLIIQTFGLGIPLHSAQASFLGLGVDLIVIFAFGALLFYLAFRIFGRSLTESSGGISGVFHKKVAEAQDKMFNQLDPEDRKVMEYIASKVDLLEVMSVVQEDPSKLLTVFEKAGLTNEEANKFMKIGMKLMQDMNE